MPDSEFEKNVQQTMAALGLTPDESVWNNIAAALPGKKKRRPWFLLWLTPALMIAGFFWWQYFNAKRDAGNPEQVGAIKTQHGNPEQVGIVKTPHGTPGKLAKTTYAQVKPSAQISALPAAPIAAAVQPFDKQSRAVNRRKAAIAGSLGDAAVDEGKAGIRKKKTTISAASKMTLVAPEAEVETRSAESMLTFADNTVSPQNNTMMQVADTLIAGQISANTNDSLKTYTADSVSASAPRSDPRKDVRRWSVALVAGAGVSNVRSGFLRNGMLYYSPALGSGGTTAPQQISQSKPTSGIAYSAGAYLQRSLNRRWSISAGAQYAFYSNKIQTGNRVDSASTFYYDNLSLTATGFYRNGKSVDYTNKFHFIKLPLLLTYNTSGAFFARTGVSLGYMIHTNSLLYKNGVYFSSQDGFNNVLFKLDAGAGFTIRKKTGFPVSLEYRMGYSPGSISKKTFANQHLIHSGLFLSVPLNK